MRRQQDSTTNHDHKYLVYAGGRPVAQVLRTEQDGAISSEEIRYVHSDLLGSPEAITSTSGSVVHRQTFETWGTSSTPAWQSSDLAARRLTEGFTGHEHDPDAGLVNMRGRIYDPHSSQFLQPDPFMQAPFHSQGLNRFSYVFNNPQTLI